MLVFAIIIGVSKYQSELLPSLPAAQADAICVARALVHWGVPESHIALLCSDLEKKEALDRILKKLSQRKDPFQLVFYYCGHGYRTTGSYPKSFLMFSDSKEEENSWENAFELEELLQKISQLNTTNTYLFIDACHLRLNSIMNPKFLEEIQGKKNSKKSFFCLLSSGVLPSYESVDNNYGFFTDALLKALSEIRGADRSPSVFFHHIQKELKRNGLPDPEMYNIGTHAIDFFPSLFSSVNKGTLVRPRVIADLQDVFVRNRGKPVCIVGPSGSGKKTLARQLSSSFLHIHLISNPRTLEKFIHYHSTSVLIFDSDLGEDPQKIKEIFELFAKELFTVVFLFDTQLSSQELRSFFIEFNIPMFTKEETKLLVEASQPFEGRTEIFHLVSKGNPLKLKQALENMREFTLDPKEGEQIKKAIAAVYSCGLFVNEELFRKTFSIEVKSLSILEKIGLIFQEDGVWRSHDFLIEIVESEKLELDRERTLSYWFAQCEELPNHFISAHSLVLTMNCFGYESTLDENLKAAFQVLYDHGQKGIDELKKGASLFLSPSVLTPSSLFLAEILLEWGEFDLVKRLLQAKGTSAKLNLQARISHSHLLWRTGLFSDCVTEASSLINTLPLSVEKMRCHLNRGASHFFLGNWEGAKTDFSFVNRKGRHPHYVGRARCLLGTVSGIRGIDVEESKKLIESGIKMLTKNEDFLGAWIGWNNLGEIMWKTGNLRASAYYLQKALEISENANNDSLLLETLRNLLQLEFRSLSPSVAKLNQLVERIEASFASTQETFEMMQLYNTLCTVSIYLKDHARVSVYLKKAIPLTSASKEYHIYTLANLALLFRPYHFKEKSNFYLQRARILAQEGNNLLAIRQIESDFQKITFESNLDIFDCSKIWTINFNQKF
ncbi:MAG: hypothetical protein K1000chlam2_01566 [Chlamydiae bacterium]|nr:hypothetical protein [Chlamydiota bacterium]